MLYTILNICGVALAVSFTTAFASICFSFAFIALRDIFRNDYWDVSLTKSVNGIRKVLVIKDLRHIFQANVPFGKVLKIIWPKILVIKDLRQIVREIFFCREKNQDRFLLGYEI